MDALREQRLEIARTTPPGEKLWQAFELMSLGIDLMRENLQRRHPDEDDDSIEARLRGWLHRDA